MKLRIRTLVLSLGLALTVWAQASQASSLYFSGPTSASVGGLFDLNILGDFSAAEPLAGGLIDLGYNGDKLQINSVTIAPVWDFLPRPGSQTVTGTNSVWSGIGFDVFNNPYQSGNGVLIATLHLTALASGSAHLEFLSTELYESTNWTVLNPTLTATNVTVAAVPVPPAAWLLASGLLGLVGIARRHARGGE